MPDKSTQSAGSFFDRIGSLSKLQRGLIVLITFIIIGVGYYFLIFKGKYEDLDKQRTELKKQTALLKTTKRRAAELEKYEKLMVKAQEKFLIAIKALPDKREVASLLTAMSNAASLSGLTFYNFQPKPDILKDFYIEIPISIKLEGRYHQITDFFFKMAKLNRIVNMFNISIMGVSNTDNLSLNCTAVTYMFFEKQTPK